MPGGHAVLTDDFGDHVSPARGFLVIGESKRADVAFTVTLLAAVLEDPDDLLRPGDGRLVRRRLRPADETADRLSLRLYLGYDFGDSLPDHSSLTRIRERYGLPIFQLFFYRVVELTGGSRL